MKRFLVLLAIFALAAMNVFADIRLPDTPKPKPSKSIDTNMTIRIVKDTKEATLIIPRDQVRQLRAQLDEMEGGSNDANASLNFNFTRTQTIVSGAFLSLAFVFGGVWFARSRKVDAKANKALVIAAIFCLSGLTATVVFANVGPPPEARTISGKMFSQAVHTYKYGSGRIKLEISDTASNIVLIVPDAPENKSE